MNAGWTAGENKRWNYMGKDAIIGQMGVLQGEVPESEKLPTIEI